VKIEYRGMSGGGATSFGKPHRGAKSAQYAGFVCRMPDTALTTLNA
jgi:hypothetical protein